MSRRHKKPKKTMDLENGGTKKTPFGEKTYLTFLWEVFFFFFLMGCFCGKIWGTFESIDDFVPSFGSH